MMHQLYDHGITEKKFNSIYNKYLSKMTKAELSQMVLAFMVCMRFPPTDKEFKELLDVVKEGRKR